MRYSTKLSKISNLIMVDQSGDNDAIESEFSEEDLIGSEDGLSDGSLSESSSSDNGSTANESTVENNLSNAEGEP